MKRTVKKAVVIGLSTVMVVAGSVFAYAAESTLKLMEEDIVYMEVIVFLIMQTKHMDC